MREKTSSAPGNSLIERNNLYCAIEYNCAIGISWTERKKRICVIKMYAYIHTSKYTHKIACASGNSLI